MIENLSAIFAWNGKSSQTSIPDTLVRIGENSPRYSEGAFGFMSYIYEHPTGSEFEVLNYWVE